MKHPAVTWWTKNEVIEAPEPGKVQETSNPSYVLAILYPDEHGYEADMGKDLYHPEDFSNVSDDTLCCYQQRQDDLCKHNFTAAVMRP